MTKNNGPLIILYIQPALMITKIDSENKDMKSVKKKCCKKYKESNKKKCKSCPKRKKNRK